MSTRHETALAALESAVKSAADSDVLVMRGDPLTADLDAYPGGVVNIQPDDAILDLETFGGAPRKYWILPVSIECVVQSNTAASRLRDLDLLVQAVAGAVVSDNTLAGAVDHADLQGPAGDQPISIEGAAGLHGAVVGVDLRFSTGANIYADV